MVNPEKQNDELIKSNSKKVIMLDIDPKYFRLTYKDKIISFYQDYKRTFRERKKWAMKRLRARIWAEENIVSTKKKTIVSFYETEEQGCLILSHTNSRFNIME